MYNYFCPETFGFASTLCTNMFIYCLLPRHYHLSISAILADGDICIGVETSALFHCYMLVINTKDNYR